MPEEKVLNILMCINMLVASFSKDFKSLPA